MTDLIFILHFSCTYFNPTKAASLHRASLLLMENTQKLMQLCQGGLGTTLKLRLRIEQELFSFEWLYIPVSNLRQQWFVCVRMLICKIKYVYLEELVDISIHLSIYLQVWKNKYLFKTQKTRKKVKNPLFETGNICSLIVQLSVIFLMLLVMLNETL